MLLLEPFLPSVYEDCIYTPEEARVHAVHCIDMLDRTKGALLLGGVKTPDSRDFSYTLFFDTLDRLFKKIKYAKSRFYYKRRSYTVKTGKGENAYFDVGYVQDNFREVLCKCDIADMLSDPETKVLQHGVLFEWLGELSNQNKDPSAFSVMLLDELIRKYTEGFFPVAVKMGLNRLVGK